MNIQLALTSVAHQVAAGSNRVLDDQIAYGYDARGNRQTQARAGSTASYTYDAFNHTASISRNAATTYASVAVGDVGYPAGTTTFTTNGLDQRVAKHGPHGSRRYIHGGQTQLLAEAGSGNWSSYIWLGGELVGLVRNNTLYYVHGDHLTRPESVTNGARAVVWKAKNYAQDRKVALDAIGGLNIGFPGQYHDAETGLWYNGYRYYDSRIGKYTQSDPIGLAGGLNTYAYTSGNPVNSIDPFGLTECDINAAIDFANNLVEKKGLSGIDVPSRVGIAELHDRGPNVLGTTSMGYIFRPVTLDNRYMAELTDADAVMLLGTVLHESMHRAQDWNWSWKSDAEKASEHSAIYQRANELKGQLGADFLKERGKQCGCQ